jgi:hypothetical protein
MNRSTFGIIALTLAGFAPPAAPADSNSPAHASYRRMWEPDARYPLLEVFVPNPTKQTAVWSKAWLDGKEIVPGNDGVLWQQWYPSYRAAPGQTVLLQISLAALPASNQVVQVENDRGEQFEVVASPTAQPVARITGISFNARFTEAYVTYERAGQGQSGKGKGRGSQIEDRGWWMVDGRLRVERAWVNGVDRGRRFRQVNAPREKLPGMIVVPLPKRVAQGQPVHIRLEFTKESPSPVSSPAAGRGDSVLSPQPSVLTAQEIVRAHWGISLDSWGLGENDIALRKELGLDLRPRLRHIPDGEDPNCTDMQAGQVGKSGRVIAPARQRWFEQGDDRLSYPFLCVVNKGHFGYPVYGRVSDAAFVAPYCLRNGSARKVIEEEETLCAYTLQAARPRPWGWIPQAFAGMNGRITEPPEFRLGTYAALGLGAKGIMYFTYDREGFQNSRPLLEEIKNVNREIKSLEPLLGGALSVGVETQDVQGDLVRVGTLWSPERWSLVVIVRNLDYRTDRENNDWGARPRFRHTPKRDITVRIRPPDGFRVTGAKEALSGKKLAWQRKGDRVLLQLGDLDLGVIVQVTGRAPNWLDRWFGKGEVLNR